MSSKDPKDWQPDRTAPEKEPDKRTSDKKPGNGFWKLGGRTQKTVLATFISLVVDGARPDSMPFYAAITAIFCVQKSASDSFETAVNREISTILGGAFGMAFLWAEQSIGGFDSDVLRAAAASLVLIPIISISVWLGRPKSTFLMCVVFLSVTIMHGADVHPFFYPFNRVLDTTIGIVTALLVDNIPRSIAKRRLRKSDTDKQTAPDSQTGSEKRKDI